MVKFSTLLTFSGVAALLVLPSIAAPIPDGYWNDQGVWIDTDGNGNGDNGNGGNNGGDGSSSSSSSSSSGGGFSGRATWFNTGLGACGGTNNDGEKVVAINSAQYSGGSHCGKTVTIKNNKSGATTTAKAVDECPSCPWGALDLSPAAFSAIGNLDDGVESISWWFD